MNRNVNPVCSRAALARVLTRPERELKPRDYILVVAFCLIFTTGLAQQSQQQELVNKYCVTCHNEKAKSGGLVLEKVDVDHPAANDELREKAIRKLRAVLMPPSGAPRPDRAVLESFRAALEAAIDQGALAKPNPGVTTLHRLNRTEYANAIRDLLSVDVDVATILPADDSS